MQILVAPSDRIRTKKGNISNDRTVFGKEAKATFAYIMREKDLRQT